MTNERHLSRFDLTGRTALVTGSRRGIGRAIAAALAEAGADIIGVSATIAAGSEVEGEVEAAGRSFTAIRADLGERGQLYGLLDQVAGRTVDILVANAGSNRRRPAAEYVDDDWDSLIELNLSSQFILAREIGKTMLERGRGKVIFTASLLSFQGGITVPAYAASKGGIASLVKALSNEWAGQGVQVNGLAPGYIATDNTQALQDDPVRSKEILGRIPAGRWGTPADLAGPAVFLASPASDYVSGEILVTDGGWMGR
ncbi:MAG TPA: SDR family oxidoreductase [Acidimicrobiia bacterium]|nr:SDR family oxidoreductase [Acidimicrobiia bacterium]